MRAANPGKVHFPSPGFGTQPHLVGEMFKARTKTDIVHVPYRGSAPSITDLLAGQMQMYFDNFANLLQHVESGRLRALAVTGEARSAQLPDVPTMDESGHGGIEATYWNGMLAPAGTPPAVVARLNAVVNEALALPEVRAALHQARFQPGARNRTGIRRLHRSGGAALGNRGPPGQHQGRVSVPGTVRTVGLGGTAHVR